MANPGPSSSAFYSSAVGVVYDQYGMPSRKPSVAQHQPPAPTFQPPPQQQQQYSNHAIPHGWNRPQPQPPAGARPYPAAPMSYHSANSSASSSYSTSNYGRMSPPQLPVYRPNPPPPPPGAGPPLLPNSARTQQPAPPQRDYFGNQVPGGSNSTYPRQQPPQQQPYYGQPPPGAGRGGAGVNGSTPQYLPSGPQSDAVVNDFIGAYRTNSASSNGSVYTPPLPAPPAQGAAPHFPSYSSNSYLPSSNPSQSSLLRSQSAAATVPGPRPLPSHAGHPSPPPLPTSSSFSGYPSSDSYASYPSYSSQNGSAYASRPEPPPRRPTSPSSSSSNSHRQTPQQQLRDRPHNQGPQSGAAPPPDAFYQAMPDLDRRKTALATVSDAAAWRSTREPSIYENGESTDYGAQQAYPSRQQQPTIFTTAPVTAERTQRTPSLSSQNSTASSSTHPGTPSTFAGSAFNSSATSVSTSTYRPSNSRGGTLSPNTSLLAGSSFLSRADSGSSVGDASRFADGFEGDDFRNVALLSHVAVWLRDNVSKGLNAQVAGGVEHPDTFTGEEVVVKILSLLPNRDRRYAVAIARSLQQSLWFHDVDWDDTFKETGVYAFDNQEYVDETPTGVLTSLTKCISPYCGKLTEAGDITRCYSYTCPNVARNQLQRHESSLSATSGEEAKAPDNWVTFVGESVVAATPKREVQRQLNMWELIDGEEKYLADLMLLQKNFVDPLITKNPPIISPERLSGFLAAILLNIDHIREHSRIFLETLKARQAKSPVISGIGDIVLEAALDWGSVYLHYMVEFPMAHVLFAEEEASNPGFRDHVMDFSKSDQPATRVGFKSFQSRPTFRLLRYGLLLGDILKHTENNDEDRQAVEQAMAVIKSQGLEANAGIVVTESKVKCREFHKSLVTKTGESYTTEFDLDLLEKSRRHIVSNRTTQKSTNAGGLESWSDGFWILFDHYLVMSKPARGETQSPKYVIPRRGTIPLDFLVVKRTSFTEPAIPRTTRFHIGTQKANDVSPSAAYGGGGQEGMLYPISLQRIGRDEGVFTFYVESAAMRTEWATNLPKAIEAHAARQKATQVIALDVLSDQTFGAAETYGSLVPPAPVESQFGNPTCSAPLTTADGQNLVVAGCAQGLFIGFRGKPRTMKQVVHLAGITQCAILAEFGFILVVAQKVLIAYSLEALVPSGTRSDLASKTPQRLSGSRDVLFMRVGKVGDVDPRTLVIYVKKSGVKESVFKALEPVSAADRNRAAGKHGFLGMGSSKNPEWFRTYKDFFLPSFVHSFRFLRSKLAIVCAKGVEIMNLESLRTMSVPDFSAPGSRNESNTRLAKRCEENTTLGMFRLQDNLFLLVYKAFCFHVDKHGEPVLGHVGIIDWESRPEQVAFQSPFIYAVSSKVVEIRNAFTGRLVQVITGREINLTYDGDAIESGVVDVRRGPPVREEDHPDRRLHLSMRIDSYHVLYEVRPV